MDRWMHFYLSFSETECKTWIDGCCFFKNSKSRLQQNVANNKILPTLQRHLSSFLSGISSSNTRELMINEILRKYPSDRYRNCREELRGRHSTTWLVRQFLSTPRGHCPTHKKMC